MFAAQIGISIPCEPAHGFQRHGHITGHILSDMSLTRTSLQDGGKFGHFLHF
jgi:hypothetical protein